MQVIKNIGITFLMMLLTIIGGILFMCLTVFVYIGWFVAIFLMFWYFWIGLWMFLGWLLAVAIFTEIVGSIHL